MLLELKNIKAAYGNIKALKGINLAVPEGKIVTLIGANGAGKSTTMKTIMGVMKPIAGDVLFKGESIAGKKTYDIVNSGVVLVPEGRQILQGMTVRENIELGAYHRNDKKEIAEDMAQVFERFPRLFERQSQFAGTLSGGEQQRVCIARALINCPKLILADEPTGNLDEKNEKIVLDLFRQLHEQGTTIIVVTHDALVASCAQREIMLNHGVLVGEKWNDEAAKKAYEQAGGKPAYTGSAAEGAQNGETAISFADPTKAAKTGGEE